MSEIKTCPCGGKPTAFNINDNGQGGKYLIGAPNCCGEWLFEFRADYIDPECEEAQKRATSAWNELPRTQDAEIHEA